MIHSDKLDSQNCRKQTNVLVRSKEGKRAFLSFIGMMQVVGKGHYVSVSILVLVETVMEIVHFKVLAQF